MEIKGKVIDGKTGDALPFATIALKNYNLGTVSDQEGNYTLKIASGLKGQEVVVSYIGYENYVFLLEETGYLEVKMNPATYEFDEVVIRSVSAQQFLKKVINKIPDNYLNVPFETLGYYRERFDEGEKPVKYVEAAFLSYQFPYLSDSTNQHRLILYQQFAEEEIQFMSERANKRKAKARRKAEKKNLEFDEDQSYSAVSVVFSGPEETLKVDPVRGLTLYLDTTLFRKFDYNFEGPTFYNGRFVEVIGFEAKVKMENEKPKGLIYVDKQSLAIIKVEEKTRFYVPVIYKPILFALGFGIDFAFVTKSFKYKSFSGKWYPENIHLIADAHLQKRFLFKENEKAVFRIEQVFSTKRVVTKDVDPIPLQYRYDQKKKMPEQLFALPDISWQQVK